MDLRLINKSGQTAFGAGIHWIFGGLAIILGLATIAEGGSVLLGSRSATAAAGNFVPLVLWVNFLSGFFYVLAGTGIVMARPSGLFLARGLAVVLLVLFSSTSCWAVHGRRERWAQ